MLFVLIIEFGLIIVMLQILFGAWASFLRYFVIVACLEKNVKAIKLSKAVFKNGGISMLSGVKFLLG